MFEYLDFKTFMNPDSPPTPDPINLLTDAKFLIKSFTTQCLSYGKSKTATKQKNTNQKQILSKQYGSIHNLVTKKWGRSLQENTTHVFALFCLFGSHCLKYWLLAVLCSISHWLLMKKTDLAMATCQL